MRKSNTSSEQYSTDDEVRHPKDPLMFSPYQHYQVIHPEQTVLQLALSSALGQEVQFTTDGGISSINAYRNLSLKRLTDKEIMNRGSMGTDGGGGGPLTPQMRDELMYKTPEKYNQRKYPRSLEPFRWKNPLDSTHTPPPKSKHKIEKSPKTQLLSNAIDAPKKSQKAKETILNIIIESEDKRDMLIEVGASNIIEFIKQQIAEILGVPIIKQQLIFNGITLQNHKSLIEYNLFDSARVKLMNDHPLATKTIQQLIKVKDVKGKKTFNIDYDDGDTVSELKLKISQKENIPINEQRLFYPEIELEDEFPLSHYNLIGGEGIVYLVLNPEGIKPSKLDLSSDLFDPFYDFDYTRVDDMITHSRGGHLYMRPCGWKRYALRVKGRYQNDQWLDMNDAEGEWVNAYHGTQKEAISGIMAEGFKVSTRDFYGQGIYTTPYIEIAEKYASTFFWKGKAYNVVLQNRINPKTMKTVNGGMYYLSKDRFDLRPYGVCIREKERSFKIQVIGPKKKLLIEVENCYTIRTLKVLIYFEERAISLSHLLLEFKGKILDEQGGSVGKAGIVKGCIVYIRSGKELIVDQQVTTTLKDKPKFKGKKRTLKE